MQLQPEDLEELADFFAKRFPSPADREALVRSTGLDTVLPSEPLPAWLVLLATAQQSDRMGVLIQAAAGLRPEDDSLSDVAEAFSAQKKLPIGKALISLVVLFALGLGAWGWFATSEKHINQRVPATPSTVDLKPEKPLLPRPLSNPAVIPELPAQPIPDPAVALVGPVELVDPPAIVPIDDTPPETDGEWIEGRCGGPAGRLVGYWYAGAPFEPGQGERYALKNSKNVRADYPRRENGWDAREPVTCVLKQGDSVDLTHAPILVDGGKYWVPLYSGDLKL
ncbi:MAG: hypothetical protein ACI9VR_001262 [Cognaticolwellia sp.]|jgi:hypothetical protein